MRELGKIVRLQVQQHSTKTGTKPFQTYSPTSAIVPVQTLRMDSNGVEGIDDQGQTLPDVHNATHPQTKFTGNNSVSIGFTSHYVKMRDRFGDHLSDGAAGENIIVNCDDRISLDMIEAGIVIQGENGEVRIGPWEILNPCNPFTKFCLQLPGDTKPDRNVTEALQFLMHGMRGFNTIYTGENSPVEIRVGDSVYLAD